MKFQLGDSREIRAHSAATLLNTVAGECPFQPHVGVVGGISSPTRGATATLLVASTLAAGLPRVKVRTVSSLVSVGGEIMTNMEVL